MQNHFALFIHYKKSKIKVEKLLVQDKSYEITYNNQVIFEKSYNVS